eukprot:777001-Prorocentrum_minimum.AAC.1
MKKQGAQGAQGARGAHMTLSRESRPSSAGMVPESMFDASSSVLRSVTSPREDGMGPVKLLASRPL